MLEVVCNVVLVLLTSHGSPCILLINGAKKIQICTVISFQKNKPIIWPLENKLKSKSNRGFDKLLINTLGIIKPKFELLIFIYLLLL